MRSFYGVVLGAIAIVAVSGAGCGSNSTIDGGMTVTCESWCAAVTASCADPECMHSCTTSMNRPTQAALDCVNAAGADCAASGMCWSLWF